ncbi:uncharacterized protein QC764_0101910 [Podospora pseudoanserina]|uniref:Uncharacterized protein n=1 Tax=Podospora pseudoanserina TaxID=2609844 RepID=A0ABR0HKM9_9PEZI|nr:hypothetical protein QC764_0101910 [Podospora pseudoanserina]
MAEVYYGSVVVKQPERQVPRPHSVGAGGPTLRKSIFCPSTQSVFAISPSISASFFSSFSTSPSPLRSRSRALVHFLQTQPKPSSVAKPALISKPTSKKEDILTSLRRHTKPSLVRLYPTPAP